MSVFIRTCKIILIFARWELKWIFQSLSVCQRRLTINQLSFFRQASIWKPTWDYDSSKFRMSNAQFRFHWRHKMFFRFDFVSSIHRRGALFLESRAYSARRILDLMVEVLKHFWRAYKLIISIHIHSKITLPKRWNEVKNEVQIQKGVATKKISRK